MKAQTVDFVSALKHLRERLGETSQGGMARRLGEPEKTYQNWEKGIARPGGQSLVGILALCPDEETRAMFGAPAAIGVQAARAEASPRQPSPEETRALLILRMRNLAVEGIEMLYEMARAGNNAALEHLRTVAAQVVRIAGDLYKAEIERRHK